MPMHIELHLCRTASEAQRLGYGGLPRYDLEPSTCDACGARVGEVQGQGDVMSWRPLTVVVWDTGLAALCARCVKPITKVVS